MGMTLAQQTDCARQLATGLFQGSTATIHHGDILAAVQAIDAAFDTTLTVATASVGGGTTIINALAASIPVPASGGTAAQKTLLAVYVLEKRAGLR